jgi:flagellum-specific ATP synthase
MTSVDLTRFSRKLDRLDILPCKGKVVSVTGLTVESLGPPVGMGQLCAICLSDGRRILAEVVGFNNQNRILLPLEATEGTAPGDYVVAVMTHRHIMLDDSVLGRVLDGLGRPIDDKGPLTGRDPQPLDNPVVPAMSRPPIREPLAFGVRAFDGLLTCGRGQRLGIFAGSGVGKSTLLGEIARNSQADVNVLALVGERGREVRQFLEESLGEKGLARSVVCVATSDTSPIQRVKVAFTATSIAEYFRDKGKNVLFMMDSLTRFAQAQREIGLACGEPPTTKGYCPSVFGLLPRLTERLGCSDRGSITGIYTILVEGDDMNDPVADSVRSLLDGHIVLSRKLAEVGHYPAVDILQSVSRLMSSVASPRHLLAARKFRAIYATYLGAEDLINIGALAPGSNKKIDQAIALIDRVNDFLIQSGGTKSTLAETVDKLCAITESWNFLAGDDEKPAGKQAGAAKR